MAKLFGAFLAKHELSLLQVSKEVATTKTLHHNVDVVLILKNVK